MSWWESSTLRSKVSLPCSIPGTLKSRLLSYAITFFYFFHVVQKNGLTIQRTFNAAFPCRITHRRPRPEITLLFVNVNRIYLKSLCQMLEFNPSVSFSSSSLVASSTLLTRCLFALASVFQKTLHFFTHI
jgi:hypothetical protein